MKFFNPEVVFDGIIQIDGTINNDKHAITRGFLKANSIVGIHTDSANFAEMITVGDEKHLKFSPILQRLVQFHLFIMVDLLQQ